MTDFYLHMLLSHVQLFGIPWSVASQTPLSMGFSRQEYWSGLPFPPPGDLPHPEIKPRSLALQEDSLLSESPGKPQNQLSFKEKKFSNMVNNIAVTV